MLKLIRQAGSLACVLGLFTVLFAGIPWYVIFVDDPPTPPWLKAAVLCILGGILVVLLTVSLEQLTAKKESAEPASSAQAQSPVLLLNSAEVPGRPVIEVLGLVQGHTVFAIWLGNDLSALMRLILGGELTEYTALMGQARKIVTDRMASEAGAMGADAVINVRYMTSGVVGTASELLVYGTAVKLSA